MAVKFLPAEEQRAEKNFRFLTSHLTKDNFLMAMPTGTNRLDKSEILRNKGSIQHLFTSSSSIKKSFHPLRVILCHHQNNSFSGIKVLFVVSSRNFKKATHRNLLKRRMREAYRQNKHFAQTSSQMQMDVGFIYNTAEMLSYQQIEKAMIKSIHFILENNK